MLEIRREAGALDGTQWHAAGAPSGYMTDPVSDAALAAFVWHAGWGFAAVILAFLAAVGTWDLDIDAAIE